MLRCLIVDDNPRFVDAARVLLQQQGIAIVGVASCALDALRCVAELRPDVALVDIDLHGESGFDVVRRLSREARQISPRTILISAHDEEDYSDLIAASPAVGFLPKTAMSAHAILNLLGLPITDLGSGSHDQADVGPPGREGGPAPQA